MPELPEVETLRRALAPNLAGAVIARLVVRHRGLRVAVPVGLEQACAGRVLEAPARRSKYLLLPFRGGSGLLVHLGMSGTLRLFPEDPPSPAPHDHWDLVLEGGAVVRLHDPRRFGCLLPLEADGRHPLLASLGPEPFGPEFSAASLQAACAGRKVGIKAFLLAGTPVCGVGNIYSDEALFRAGIHPLTPAGRLDREACTRLFRSVRAVLREAIRLGGSTIRDFRSGDGSPGYFQLRARVYGRAGESCVRCGGRLRGIRAGQRSAVFCPGCQIRRKRVK